MLGRVSDLPLAVVEVEVVLVSVEGLVFQEPLFVLQRGVLLAVASLRGGDVSI